MYSLRARPEENKSRIHEVPKNNELVFSSYRAIGMAGDRDVRRKQWKVCNRFPVVSSSAGALYIYKWSLRMLLFG